MAESQAGNVAYLVPITGSPIESIALTRKSGGLTLGRHEQCDLRLPPDAEKVSRFHARFAHDGKTWRIADLQRRWGTFVNGVKLEPGPDVPLSEGDLVRIVPWTFSFSSHPKKRGMATSEDAGRTLVRSVQAEQARLADDMLSLLLESAAGIHGAKNEQQLAQLLLDAAVAGTGLSNAVMLKPVDTAGRVEIVASKMSGAGESGAPPTFSRSLINTASTGVVAELSGAGNTDNISQSIVQMNITAALCVPLMLGNTVAAYLYLDSRGGMPGQALRRNASAFCVALGRIGSLALANLKRIDMERRQAAIESDLKAAAAAQKWILPKRENKFEAFHCIGESRPGQYVGGDFFDIIDLGEGKLAVAVGDVSGKGVAASVLMTATQGFLHAALKESRDPGRAVTEVNRFVNPRRPENKFVTMWVGVFDARAGTLSYVDAGHSYATIKNPDGSFTPLDTGGGLPIGITEDGVYAAETVALSPGACAMIVSDGIIEEFGVVERSDGSVEKSQFQMDGLRRAMSASNAGDDYVANVFKDLIDYAGTDHLADDATAVWIGWA
jgi:serine phosphatase RsbU (regulator of sigma subunit)/pSer/pThr/pTyr-binding forkhead associated (FHA) protein